ncbi:MAG: protein-glutamate O-methyltransferase CheR [Lachnospiraceae bacterium]|nr:protein-glutamate O-methyltransferase CheR [Lachnospiraceae bacterium]
MLFDYEYFKREVRILTGIDLSSYKEAQMKRRIDSLLTKNKIPDYGRYVMVLKTDKERFEEFVNQITINVSEFYRDPPQWKMMEDSVIPALIRKFGKNLKVWSAACSTGDEPYSLVLAMSRHLPLSNIRIHATDLDKQVIAKAKEGVYPEKSIAAVPPDLRRRYFTQIGDSFRIAKEIKACVEFREHNLLKDVYPMGCHLIVCRNVLIYFTEEAKDVVFQKYFRSLANGGVLFIGSAEQIMNFRDIGFEKKHSLYYQKP